YLGCRLEQTGMKRCRNRQYQCSARALCFGAFASLLDRLAMARNNDLTGRIIIHSLYDLRIAAALRTDGLDGFVIQTYHSSHGALANRHGVLHGASANTY